MKHGFAIISWLMSQHVSSGFDASNIFVEHERSVKKFSLWPLWLQLKTFNDYYGNHFLSITTIVPTTIAEIDLISIMWKHGGRLVNASDGLQPLVCSGRGRSSVNFKTGLRRASLKRCLIHERYHFKTNVSALCYYFSTKSLKDTLTAKSSEWPFFLITMSDVIVHD